MCRFVCSLLFVYLCWRMLWCWRIGISLLSVWCSVIGWKLFYSSILLLFYLLSFWIRLVNFFVVLMKLL